MNISLSGKNSRNLLALKAIDKSIEEIVTEASHIAVYEFDSSTQQWKRFNVEGSAFIVRRNCGYLLIVLNKQGLDNLVLELEDCKKAKIQVPYIMMKCSTKKAPIIFGLWFHNDNERNEVYQAIVSVLEVIDSTRRKNSSPSMGEVTAAGAAALPGSINLQQPLSPATSLRNILSLPSKHSQSSVASSVQSSWVKEQETQVAPLIAPSTFTGKVKTFYREE